MIQKKIYSSMLQRGVMTLLLLVLSVTAMWADQAIVVDITGGHNTWSLQVDGETVTSFNASGEATVSGKNGKTAVLTLTPETGYTVTNFIIYTTHDFLSPSPTRINPGATQIDYGNSGDTYTFTMPADEANGVYIKATIINSTSTNITSLSQITDTGGTYIITSDISGGSPDVQTFSGTLEAAIDPETHMPYRISGLSAPLFETLTGTVKNLVLESVSITSGDDSGNTGAIACTANGAARIYNVGILSGSVGGTAYTGGLVGFLDGTARVINCYSYADITGGSDVGGIVGYNNVTTTSANNNQKTMVMNCMFYGDITGSTTISPIYGGKSISNAGTNGVGNYNYFRLEAPYVQPTGVTYNCALGAEDRFLQRFEFYRLLLNSHRELAGWWATGIYSSSDMMKWVLEPSQLDSDTPYPILKVSGKYPSVVNIDAEHATTQTERNKGGKLGTLSVTIRMGSGGAVYGPPTGAKIETASLTLNITDKDPDHYNFNYYKVQLPYYNDVGTKNYNGNRVVTGWKIVSITGGTPGTFTASDTWGGYNFADRNCTNKDLYGTDGSNRIFNQGAYWDVPEGVSAITIEPYWAKCVYLADPNADKVYKSDMSTGYDVPNVGGGQKYTNGNSYSIAGESQVVYTSIGNAIASSGTALYSGVSETDRNNQSVYDYAVVLVGNYHHYYTTGKIEASKSKPYTVTSIDLDGDNEPDYSYILRFDGRCETHPVRADFINIPGLGMAQKSTGGTGSYNFGILIPKGWYESTNTSLLRFTQFEYEHKDRSTTDAIIVQGGVMEQWVSNNQKGTSNKIPYIHVGGNVWFKEFHTGCHQDKQIATKHSPVSVTGGDYDEFYLTGLYRGDFNAKGDNAECYINGGHFGTVCGAAMEGIGNADGASNTGNITWQIQNADIHEFYAGGLNAAKPVTGNLSTTIVDSHVDIFCGGPKFGDMSDNKTVVTNATGCTFGTFFGAGYGGNSYSRFAPTNQNSVTNINWNNWISSNYSRAYNGTYGGVSTQFSYQFLPMSDNKTNVARIFVDFVKFSLATCRNVTSTLTGCKITGNFYGGGSLGSVEGNVTSTLTDCEVSGSAFGAGFSASLPTVEVDSIGFRTEPYYYTDLGTYRSGEKGPTTTYTWQKKTGNSWVDNEKGILYTEEDLTSLGKVTGLATLNINGSTTVVGSVYGGGEESNVSGNTNVYICAKQNGNDLSVVEGNPTINGNVFGGGKGKADNYKCDKAMIGEEGQGVIEGVLQPGGTTVIIGKGTVAGDVYGGGEVGRVERNTQVTIGLAEGSSKPIIKGNVYGAGAGVETHGYSALVRGNSSVTVQGEAEVEKSVYGGGKTSSVGRFKVVGGLPTEPQSGGNCTVIIQGKAKVGSGGSGDVFGSCQGVKPTYSYTTSTSYDERMTNSKCMQTSENKPDGDEGKTWDYYKDKDGNEDRRYVWEYFLDDDDYYAFLKTLALASKTSVTIGGTAASVKGSVYGGGQRGITLGKVNVEMTGGTVEQDIYGGGALADTNKSNCNESYEVVTVEVGKSVTGLYKRTGSGTQAQPYKYTEITGKKTAVSGTTYCRQTLTRASTTEDYTTNVILKGGTVSGNIYGGGLGQMEIQAKEAVAPEGEEGQEGYIPGKPAVEYVAGIAAKVFGDVTVKLNENNGEGNKPNTDNCKVKGSIFGCNNLNGTPMGDVTVHVYKTVGYDDAHKKSDNKDNTTYDLAAVYGGGNLAAYEPYGGKNSTYSTHVIIDGCGLTSIQTVYGGGNAASTPATNVTVNATYEIEEVFGGGNGKDNIVVNNITKPNPGANVGFYDYSAVEDIYNTKEKRTTDPETSPTFISTYVYGTGAANVNIFGGTIHRVFGGSNTKGNVRQTAVTMLDEAGGCDFCVDEAYGGGKSAPMDAEAKLLMACIPGLTAAYGGAEAADVRGNVALTITNGTFDRVFGGNNLSGTISGSITVNVKEVGCKPIKIGELYGGGNQAGYSVYGYDSDGKPIESGNTPLCDDPQVNVISFTSIGNIYGGGYGDGATMVGNPTVNINVVEGKYANETVADGDAIKNGAIVEKTEQGYPAGSYPIPSHASGKIGAIDNVFGGGNAAKVIGNTTVNIGTLAKVSVGGYVVKEVEVGASVAGLFTRSGAGTVESPYTYTATEATDVAVEGTTYYEEKDEMPVIGADIRGNVYGGGNEAEVTGNTSVNIGNSTE